MLAPHSRPQNHDPCRSHQARAQPLEQDLHRPQQIQALHSRSLQQLCISQPTRRHNSHHGFRICVDHSRLDGESRSHVQRNVLINIREQEHVYMTNKTQRECRGTRSCNNVFRTRLDSLITSLRGGVLHIKALHHLHRLRHIVTVVESRCHLHSH